MIAIYARSGVVRCTISLLAAAFWSITVPGAARADLDEYIKKPDSAFAWSQVSNISTKAGSITSIKLTSQVWQGITWSSRPARLRAQRNRSSRRDVALHYRRQQRA